MKTGREESFFAERRLLCSAKDSKAQIEIVFRVNRPRVATIAEAGSIADGETCICVITIDGLEEPATEYFGMDSIQALQLASDLDPLIRRLSARYDFFWSTGEPYFDGDE